MKGVIKPSIPQIVLDKLIKKWPKAPAKPNIPKNIIMPNKIRMTPAASLVVSGLTFQSNNSQNETS